MPVSYLSQPIKSSAYVPAVDLGTFARVLSVKQEQFDLGAQKAQDAVNQLASLDVMRPQDRQYVNDKINSLTSTINNFGGKDFSDPNVLNQIEGLGSDIYNDPSVINAVTSTKQVRKLISGYDEYKTNPKLSSLYSAANESSDMQAVNDWYSNKDVGTSYQGSSSPTPFVPYKANMMKALDKVKVDKTTNVMVDGYYIDKTDGSRILPDRLAAIAQQQLTPDEQAQMKRDGVYLYTKQQHLSPQDIINKSLDQYQQKVNDAVSMKAYYDSQAKASANDPTATSNYIQLSNEKAKEITSLTKNPNDTVKTAMTKFQQDPQEFMGQVYTNDFIRGMANMYSVNQTSRTITSNPVQMFQDRQAQLQRNFDLDYAQKNDHYLGDLQERYFRDGKKVIVDPTTGEITTVPLTGGLTDTGLDTRNPDDIKVTPESLKKNSDDLKLQGNKLWTSFANKFFSLHDIGTESPSTDVTGTGTQLTFPGQNILEGVNKEPGFQYEDLAGVEDKNTQNQLLKAGMTQDQLTTLMNLNNNLKAVMEGKGKLVGKIDPEFANVAQQVALIKEAQKTNDEVLKRATSKVFADAGLDAASADIYSHYLAHPEDFPNQRVFNPENSFVDENGVRIQGYENIQNPIISSIGRRINLSESDIKDKVQKYLDPLSVHNIFPTKILGDADTKDGSLASLVYTIADRLDKKSVENTGLNVSNITPTSMGMMGDGSGKFYITADVKGVKGLSNITVPINDEAAKRYGLQRDPMDYLNQSVNMMSRSGDIPVYVNNNLAVPVTIVRPDKTDPNSETYAQVRFYELDGNGEKIKDPNNPGKYKYTVVTIPNTNSSTAGDSFRKAQATLQKAGSLNMTIQDLKKTLSENQ